MMIESLIALAGILLLIIAVPFWADRKYQQARREQRMLDRQVMADTCDAHGVFCCPRCFDMSIVS